MSTQSPDWVVGHPSENKSFVATVVIASLIVTAFFVGTGFMLYFWIKSWREKNGRLDVSRSAIENEKATDLEAQRPRPGTPPPDDSYDSDQLPIAEGSKWRQETVSTDVASSQASSTRTSSELSAEGRTPERPRSRDFHEYPSP